MTVIQPNSRNMSAWRSNHSITSEIGIEVAMRFTAHSPKSIDCSRWKRAAAFSAICSIWRGSGMSAFVTRAMDVEVVVRIIPVLFDVVEALELP
jgi:hypothetical protein